jgi:hypothetical protein
MSAPIYEATTPLVSDRFIITLVAGEDLDIGQVVEITADWTVKKTTGVSYKVKGVTLTKATNGSRASIICRGIVRVTAQGNISVGDQVSSAAYGRVSTYATKDSAAIGCAFAAAVSGGTAYIELW